MRRSVSHVVLGGLLAAGIGLLVWRRPRAGRADQVRQPPVLPAGVGGRPPLAPPGLLQRLWLALQLARTPGFLAAAQGPAYSTHYLEHDILTIIKNLDHELRPGPGKVAQVLARYTTFMKHAGIMGWADFGREVVIEGWIDNHGPVRSSDGMLTVDLCIARLWVDQQELSAQLTETCHVRVEIFGAVRRGLQRLPEPGSCLRITGRLRLDHDGSDFYEIHPTTSEDIQVLDCQRLGSPPRRDGQRRRRSLRSRIWPFD